MYYNKITLRKFVYTAAVLILAIFMYACSVDKGELQEKSASEADSEKTMNQNDEAEETLTEAGSSVVWTFDSTPVKIKYSRMWESGEYAECDDAELISEIVEELKELRVGNPTDMATDDFTDVLDFEFEDGSLGRIEIENECLVTEDNKRYKISHPEKLHRIRSLLDEVIAQYDPDSKDVSADEAELSELEKQLKSNRYIGFLTEEFLNPEDITWEGVFYMGAGLYDDEKYSDVLDDITDAFCGDSKECRETADEFGLDIIDGKVLRDFVKGTSGIDVADVKKPLGLTYFDKWDIYVQYSASDANAVDIKLISMETDDDGKMKIEYENAGEPFTLVLEKNGDYLRFISNVWTPSEGRSNTIHKMYSKAIAEYEEDPSYPIDKTGYYLFDINGDNIEELFIEELKNGKQVPNIFRIYTVRMGKLNDYYDIRGSEYDCFYLSNDNTIYEQIYSGAAQTYYIHWKDASQNTIPWLTCIDVLVYNEENEGGEEHPWYHVTNNYQYENEDYQDRISEKEFNEWYNRMNDSLVLSIGTPLSNWKFESQKNSSEDNRSNKKSDSKKKDSGLNTTIAAAYDEIASKKEFSYDNENGSFALHDLNADGIPELIIDPDGMFVSDNLYYTYDNGKVISIDVSQMDIPVYGTFLTSSKSGTFCFYRGGPATYDDNDRDFMPHMYIEYALINGKIKERDRYTGLNYEDDDSWKCSMNGEECSYSNFNRFVESMDETVAFVDNTAANRHVQGLE
ncbi:MAG: hypothetical protein K6G27_06285 [Lachnospiraceae bacterium]|nr:hypothetical protein [Lachnospiraceae bacterium]